MDLRPPPKRSQNDVHDLNALFAWLEDHYRIFDQYVAADDIAFATAFERPQFKWKDGDQIYIGVGNYLHSGTTTQTAHWDSELTFQFGSGGSNGDSSNLAQGDWFYVYIDDSAIVAAQSSILTASEFVAVTTEPAWSDIKKGWYNGLDRCVFAVLTESGAATIREFFLDLDYVTYANEIIDFPSAPVSNAWVTVTCSVPSFCTLAQLWAGASYVDVNAIANFRTKGQTGADGHIIGTCTSTRPIREVDFPLALSSDQQIEIRFREAGTNRMDIRTHGYYLPKGI